MAEFEVDIANWVRKSKTNLRRFQLRFSQNLFMNILQNHPVQTGFMRSSWNVGLNRIDNTGAGVKGTTAAPSAASDGRIAVGLLPVMQGGVYEINFTNTANYAYFVEYGTGSMRPRAMVRKALAQAKRIADQTIAELKV
jgi:HK97 gp10 family phage protein